MALPLSIVNKLLNAEACCKADKCYKCPFANAYACNDKKIELLTTLKIYIKEMQKYGNKKI